MLLYFIPYALTVIFPLSAYQYILCLGIMGIGVAGIGLGIMHDACHGSLFSNRKLNLIMSYSLNLIGGNALSWKIQHNVLHHSFTNVHGLDEDLEAGNIMRFTPSEKWKVRHKFQHIYAWFLYSLMTFMWVLIKDFKRIMKYYRLGLLEAQGVKLWKALLTIGVSKVLYLAYTIGIPLYLGYDLWLVLTGFMLMHMLGGLMLAMIFQPAHIMENHTFVDNDVKVIHDSYESHQLKTTGNFAPTNKLLTWFCGGLNYQVEHHIFPNICHVHYPAISKIVKETAAEFNLPYRSVPSFRGALKIHQRTMKKLGQKDYQWT